MTVIWSRLNRLCLLFALLAISANASSTRQPPLKRVLTPFNPSIRVLSRHSEPFKLTKRAHTRNHVARSIDPVLHSDTLLLRFSLDDEPLSVLLRPTEDLLAPDAKLSIHSLDPLTGESVLVGEEPLRRQDYRAYSGVVIHEAHVEDWWNEEAAGLIRADELADARTRGWARITLQPEDDAWNGAMNIDGFMHHFKPVQAYLRDRSHLDPDVPVAALARRGRVGGGTIVLRDVDAITARDLPQDYYPIENQACSHDDLEFNDQQMHFQQEDLFAVPLTSPRPSWFDTLFSSTGSLPFRGISEAPSHRPNIYRRQDIAGGGNSTSTFTNNIGDTSGCPKERRVLYVGVAADCTATAAYGGNNATRTAILADMNTVSGLYTNTFNVSIGVVEMMVMDSSCPTSLDQDYPWNLPCQATSNIGINLNDRLSAFSLWRGWKGGSDGAGLWHLLTACQTGSEVGVAWLSQLCRVQSSTNSGQTTSGTGVTALTDRTWAVIAHEIGHNFGAIHDCISGCSGSTQSGSTSCCPLSRSTCNSQSNYIMSPVSSGEVSAFSQCSIGNVCTVLQSSLNTTCLYEPGGRQTLSEVRCGNGILEPGEACDPGGAQSDCCDPQTCQFTSGSVCDPTNSACCTGSCQYAPSTQVCRPAVNAECDVAETCTGSSANCPDDVTTDDGTSCGSSGQGLSCAGGLCTSRDLQCQEQGSTLNIRRACSLGTSSTCQLTCADPTGGSSCLLLDSNFVDGTECGLAGRCRNGSCQNGPWTDAAGSWIRNNLQISIPVIVVGSLLILGVLYGLIRCCCVKRNRNRTPASAAYASRRSRRNNRAQNNIPPPPMGQMQPPRPSTNTSQMSFANQGENPARNSYVPTPGAPDLPPPTYSSASPTYSRYSYQPPWWVASIWQSKCSFSGCYAANWLHTESA